MNPNYLKVPTELAHFALQERQVRASQIYLATKFLYPGKASRRQWSPKHLSKFIGCSLSTVNKAITWLTIRNWIGNDEENGWKFIRGLDHIHTQEDWSFARAVIIRREDLIPIERYKAFLIGAVLLSLVKTGRQGLQTGSQPGGPEQLHHPVSLTLMSDVLGVSRKTAYNYRKLAEKHGYIFNKENMIQIINWTPEDIQQARAYDSTDAITVELLGYADRKLVPLDRVRYREGRLYLQEPNLIYPLLISKSRRGLSRY